MSWFLPSIEALSAGAGRAVTAATGSETAGVAVEMGVTQKINSMINSLLFTGIDKVSRSVIGDENVDKVEAEIANAKVAGNKAAYDIMGFRPNVTPTQVADLVANYVMSDLHKDEWEPENFITQLNATEYVDPDPKFAEIYKTYTGVMGKPFQNTGGFHFIDETGSLVSWQYPEWNNYTVIPAIYGTWVGYASPNNRLPSAGPRPARPDLKNGGVNSTLNADILDQIAMGHDIDYHSSNHNVFSQIADFKFISRLLHQYPTMDNTQKVVAKIALKWFTTGGHVARYFFGPDAETSEVNKPEQVLPSANDIFNALNSGNSIETLYNTYKQNQSSNQNILREGLSAMSNTLVEMGRNAPSTESQDALNEYYQALQSHMPNLRNYIVQQQLGNLEVELC